MTQACYHCGAGLPAGATVRADLSGEAREFCCVGCRAAAEWLHEGGLADYYSLRSEPTAQVQGSADFSDWDSAGFARLYLRRKDGIAECDVSIASVRCAACAWLIDRLAQGIEGVASIQVDPATTHTRIRFDPERVALSAIAAQLARLGYAPSVVTDRGGAAQERRRSLKRLALAGLGAMQAMMFTEALYWGAGEMDLGTRDFFRVVAALVSTPVVLYSGAPFFRGAFNELRLGRPGMDLLVALSVGLAYLASVIETVRGGPVVYFDAAVMFVFLLSAARHVEAIARDRATARLRLLADAGAGDARRIDHAGVEQRLAITELALGDEVRVASGESVPVDGELLDDLARVDESLLSGESRAVSKARGDRVLAGSVALESNLRLRVTALGHATRIGQLRQRVGAALHQRAETTLLGEKLATRFTWIMLTLAACTALYWIQTDAARALPAALAVLAAACPCAFALAMPTTLAAAHAALARQGLIVAAPDTLSRMVRVDVVVCDKTGTLTESEPRLIGQKGLRADLDPSYLRAVAAALERGHRHPLARAFAAFDGGLPVESPQLLPGRGVSGRIAGRDWHLGRGAEETADVLVLSDPEGDVAEFAISDGLRPEAAAAVASWRRLGVIELLSGDAETRVAAVAGALAIDVARARVTPEQKRARIAELRRQGHTVLMIGDGLNDAESLACADVGIAMGGGAALAQCHADVLLLRDDLRLVGILRATAEKARRVIRQNIAWSLAYHALIVPFAVAGLMAPWLAAFGMAASSLVVTLNALRLSLPTAATRDTTANPLEPTPALRVRTGVLP